MKKIFLALATVLLASTAFASDNAGPLWTCKLEVNNIKGKGLYIGIGATKLSGSGTLVCDGVVDTVRTPVRVRMTSVGGGLGFKKIKSIRLMSADVKVSDPNNLYGKYQIVEVAPSLTVPGAGIGASIGLELKKYGKEGIGFGVDLQSSDAEGLAATVDVLSSLSISEE